MFKGMKGFINPTPEQKKENANYLKSALGVTDEEKFALYDLVMWLMNQLDDDFYAACACDPQLRASYDLVHGVYDRLDQELVSAASEDEDDV